MGGLVRTTWAAEMHTRGQRVAKYRNYYDGIHQMKLTTEMRQMFRVSDTDAEEFNDNYCAMIVDAMVDRLTVNAVAAADSEEGSTWSGELLAANRFDALQNDVSRAMIRDGESFLMVSYQEGRSAADGRVQFTHELAWDDDYGCLAIYDRSRQYLLAVVKIWWEGEEQAVNIYFPDRVDKLIYVEQITKDASGKEVVEYVLQGRIDEPDEWMTQDGQPVGVPFVHFRNRKQSRSDGGVSEIKSTIPLNDALNRTIMSMVMTAELTAFGVRWAKGFVPPANMAPGMWVYFGHDDTADPSALSAMGVGLMEQGDINPFIDEANFIIGQIGTISGTPLPGFMGGDAQSGEALKQRESALLGKIKQCQVVTGNSWEDVLALAARVQNAFGIKLAPVVTRWSCRWQDAQVRNAREMVEIVVMLKEKKLLPVKRALQLIANLVTEFGWDTTTVDEIVEELGNEQADQINLLATRIGQNRGAA